MADALPEHRMDGKVAIVTGAGSRADGIGNGRAASILLARAGAKVLLIDSMADWAEVTSGMIRQEGGTCQVQKAPAENSFLICAHPLLSAVQLRFNCGS